MGCFSSLKLYTALSRDVTNPFHFVKGLSDGDGNFDFYATLHSSKNGLISISLCDDTSEPVDDAKVVEEYE
jgi:hypothetical protein